MARIGVEQSLTNVQQALRERGHDVVELRQESDVNGCDCCVTTGIDSNIMGIQNTVTQAPVIEANGLSAAEVCEQVERNLQ
jgi:hypothetical protein